MESILQGIHGNVSYCNNFYNLSIHCIFWSHLYLRLERDWWNCWFNSCWFCLSYFMRKSVYLFPLKLLSSKKFNPVQQEQLQAVYLLSSWGSVCCICTCNLDVNTDCLRVKNKLESWKNLWWLLKYWYGNKVIGKYKSFHSHIHMGIRKDCCQDKQNL